jgi:hypothetical protein
MSKLACGLAALAAHLCLTFPAGAEDFRIQTRVYKEDDDTSISQNLTLFRNGVVYDFLSDPDETTIFDRPRRDHPGKFVILDPGRRVQAEVSLERLTRFTSNLQLWAAQHSDAFLRFLAKPEFQEELDPKQRAWVYSSKYMTYQVKATPAANAEVFKQFDDFSEWFVRLNTMLTIKTRPPYGLGRLGVNAALRPRQEIPTEVKLVVESPVRVLRRSTTYRSEHHLTPMLSQSDQVRISEVEKQLVSFKSIELEEYLQVAKEE